MLLLNAMAELRHLWTREEEVLPHIKQPGSQVMIEAIMSAIDDWAERETGHRDSSMVAGSALDSQFLVH